MVNPNPATHTHHKFEEYSVHRVALQRVVDVKARGFHAYLVLGQPIKVHISNGKQPDLSNLPPAPVMKRDDRYDPAHPLPAPPAPRRATTTPTKAKRKGKR